ncbi:MAG: PHP-associated domain-containing protein [Candidatus ainarchaeum sp.]|nr:PHP-associated domain-containing protein [Candidatus ainarchaeum sp.]MDD5096317.1 PHP-associated domain-containing protein [Candidatus ainarchaeum sp.]
MLRIDFHVHTSHSFDGRISPEQLAALSKKTGVIPAITDHDGIGAHSEFRKFGVPFIPGEEIETAQGDFIGLFVNEPVKRGVDFYEALDSFRSQGAIPYAPHMFDSLRPGLAKEEYGRASDIIEVFNARSLERFDKKAEEFAKREGKPMAAGSDSHYPYEFGTTYTELNLSEDQLQPKPLLKALKNAKIVGKRTSLLKRKIAKYTGIYL